MGHVVCPSFLYRKWSPGKRLWFIQSNARLMEIGHPLTCLVVLKPSTHLSLPTRGLPQVRLEIFSLCPWPRGHLSLVAQPSATSSQAPFSTPVRTHVPPLPTACTQTFQRLGQDLPCLSFIRETVWPFQYEVPKSWGYFSVSFEHLLVLSTGRQC